MLVRGGLSVTVLERDADAHARTQGGSLDLHPGSGQRALAAAGLIEHFHRHARPQGEEIRILGPDGQERVRHRGPATPDARIPDADGILPGRPEIDRTLLRSVLLESLPEGTVRWGQHVIDIEPIDGGGHRVSSADGSVHEFGLLVGAEGGRSQVRQLLTTAEPEPLGVSDAMMWLDLGRLPHLADLIGSGNLWCLGHNLNVGAQRSGTDDVRVSVMLRESEPGEGANQAMLNVRPVAEESARIQAAIVAPDSLATMTRMFGG